MQDPTARYRAGNGAVFTSSKCPPGPGLENSCELPFGFIWTPLAPSENARVIRCGDCSDNAHTLPPILCTSCLSYLNLYADIDSNQWTCPFCESINMLPPQALDATNPLSAVLASPTIEFCQAISGVNTDTDRTVVILALDGNLSRPEALAVGTMIQSLLPDRLSDSHQISLGLIIFDKSVSVYQLGVPGIASADVLASYRGLADTNLAEKSYLKRIQTVSDLECLWRCLAAHYGVPLPTNEEANTEPKPPSSRLEMLRKRKEARLRKQAAENIDNSNHEIPKSPWTAAKEDAPWTQPLRCTGEAIQCAVELATMEPAHDEPAPRTARIFLFTNGCPNFGDGSVVAEADHEQRSRSQHQHKAPASVDSHELARSKAYFDDLAKSAAEGGVGIDVLCTGATELGIPAYQALVEPSSGHVMSHDSFTTPHLLHNMSILLNHTWMSGIYTEETDDCNWIDGCVVDLRMAGFVEPTHLVGTGEFEDELKSLLANERAAFAQGSALAGQAGLPTNNLPIQEMIDSTLTRIHLGRYDPMSTFSVMLQLHDMLPDDDFAIFQCTARHVDCNGKTLVTRISTHRLAVAQDISEFVDSVDEEVVPVLLGKEAVYRSMYGRETDGVATDATDHEQLEKLAYDAQRDIDATIQNISGAFRLLGLEEGTRGLDLTEEGGTRAAGTSMDFAFPPELRDALRRLYHLRRGPLISPGPLQSMDDRAEKRSLFLRLPLQDCLSMMAPSLWSSGPLDPDNEAILARLSETVPPETLVLWSNCVIAGDHYQNLFVWSGKSTQGVAYDSVRKQFQELLVQQSANRFPMPSLIVVSEDDSMSRRFTSLLAPSHSDPPDFQVAHFSQLQSLSEEELTHLRSKFSRFHDSIADPSFREWFWNVASAASKGNGISLCD